MPIYCINKQYAIMYAAIKIIRKMICLPSYNVLVNFRH